MNPFRTPARGYFYVIFAALLWAIAGSSSKYLFHNGISPFQLAQLRVTISAFVLFLWLFIRRPALLKIDRNDITYFLILGTFGMAAVQIAYLFAISKLHVAAAILLEYLAPIFIALHSAVFLREKLSMSTVLAIAGATTGCYLVVGAYNLNMLNLNIAGIISGICAALAFSWWSVHGEYGMRRYDPWTVLFYALLFAALEWNVLHPPLESLLHTYSPVKWTMILYIAVAGTILPFGFYLEGINLIRSTRASITATLEPIGAGIISYIFLDEIMEPLQIAGGVLVIGAVILLQLKQEYDDKAPDIIRAQKQADDLRLKS
ncbi:DMT family transporter [Desulfococcaceae bacterium HSG8]|nr:DMT family transporter [Desulfococcaceae bacterium HSG8]